MRAKPQPVTLSRSKPGQVPKDARKEAAKGPACAPSVRAPRSTLGSMRSLIRQPYQRLRIHWSTLGCMRSLIMAGTLCMGSLIR